MPDAKRARVVLAEDHTMVRSGVKALLEGASLEVVGEAADGRQAIRLAASLRPDLLGDRAARTLLKFLGGEGAVDPHLADQLAVPMALSGKGGRVTTTEVSLHLETVAEIMSLFGIPARTFGRRGGPGGLEVGAPAEAAP